MSLPPPNSFPVTDRDNPRDERLAALLARLDAERRSGCQPSIEQLAEENPDLADELRQLWALDNIACLVARASNLSDTLPKESVADAPPVGQLPREFGDYELLAEIGRGGMGIVYKARQKGLNRLVALKMLLHGDVASTTDRARIRAEAKAVAALQHPNIVPVYDVGEAEGRDYFTMPYIEGPTLAEVLAEGPLLPREAARVLAALARAVDEAHKQGIIHRDLKPGNILCARDSADLATSLGGGLRPVGRKRLQPAQCQIADFGLAKNLDPSQESLTQSGAILGTPSFMPPEQAASNRGSIGPASDVYALGAILYNCLTGRPPFQAATRVDTLIQVLEQDPAPPRLLNPTVPRDLEMICLKCLQKAPELRYHSAAELAQDLEAFLAGEPLFIGPGELRELISRLFRPTHHITILENWGGLWMAHSAFTFALCALTWGLQKYGLVERGPYMAMWFVGILVWAIIFWWMRRQIGPVTFVERQIAHVWAAGVSGSFAVMLMEWLMHRPVLQFAPFLSIVAGMVFLCKAGILSGLFYIATGALFLVSALMVWLPQWGMLIYGATLAACYFVPGWIFYRRRIQGAAAAAAAPTS
jgi:serine/threonine protein kinase